MTTCACGQIANWPTGAISVYQSDVHHHPADLICFSLDGGDLWAVSS